MTPEELRRDEARRWLAIAARDLNAARILAAVEPAASVFHLSAGGGEGRQGVSCLPQRRVPEDPRLEGTRKQCALLDPSLSPLLEEAAGLTAYAVVFRYLDAPTEPDEAEAARALEIARRLCGRVRELLAFEPGP
jgi:hypothetical protein